MRILVAPDKFKDSLGAAEAARHIGAGLREVFPAAEITLLPIADGGEGTVAAICAAMGGEWHSCAAHDANGRPIMASYGTIEKGATAVLETSETVGLWRIPDEKRDPRRASSFGLGEMLVHAAHSGASRIIAGLGGSATNDGGLGLARALGFRFFMKGGTELGPGVPELLRLTRIKSPPRRDLPRIICAADVRSPLLGAHGASRLFAPQKGASPKQVELLEAALKHLAEVAATDLEIDARDIPGAGAAGGLGYGLMTFAGAEMRSGFEFVAECIGLEKAVRAADIIITGEGRLDAQTLQGKAPAGVAQMARKYGKKVYAIVGQSEETAEVRELFDGICVVAARGYTKEEALIHAGRLLCKSARRFARKSLVSNAAR